MIKKYWKIILLFFILLALGLWFFNHPLDIRNSYLKKGITEKDKLKGKSILLKIQEAYGGANEWKKLKKISFVQKADWYGKKDLSHWDTLPQIFLMDIKASSFDCSLKLLNGPNNGRKWNLNNDVISCSDKNVTEQEKKNYKDKMMFKNYWFQLPFRLDEADIISYAGTEELKGINYELLYITWDNENPNSDYDQYILYIHPEKYLIDHLHFTVRDKFPSVGLSTQFTDFKKINNFTLPHSQFVRQGAPGKNGISLHENHYGKIILN